MIAVELLGLGLQGDAATTAAMQVRETASLHPVAATEHCEQCGSYRPGLGLQGAAATTVVVTAASQAKWTPYYGIAQCIHVSSSCDIASSVTAEGQLSSGLQGAAASTVDIQVWCYGALCILEVLGTLQVLRCCCLWICYTCRGHMWFNT